MEHIVNYPIMYAVLELKEKGGYLTGNVSVTQGFIVSRCYVLESNIVYDSDGTNKLKHKVLFPYKDFTNFKTSFKNGKQKIGEQQVPIKNGYDDFCTYDIVDGLYTTYEDAKASANEKNDDYVRNILMDVPIQMGSSLSGLTEKEQYEIIEQRFKDRLIPCYQFEELILRATRDMEISKELGNNKHIKVLTPVKRMI